MAMFQETHPAPLARPTLAEQLADLSRITRMENAALRNLLITQRYHELSSAIALVVGRRDANWSTFATWASRTAGESIRGEEVPKAMREVLLTEAQLEQHITALRRHLRWFAPIAPELDVFELARAIIDEVSREIAEGNLRVFAELAPLFAQFAEEFSEPERRTPERLSAFLDKLAPGPPKRDGQDLLRQAFRNYFDAVSAPNGKLRAERMLFANLLIGLHEQTRLQPNIARAMDAPFSERIYQRFGANAPRFLQPLLRSVLRLLVRWFGKQFLTTWEQMMTRYMMRLSAPHGTEISLGRDLSGGFPEQLRQLTDPELLALVQRFDPGPNTLVGSGARNWCLLENRMNFIGDLFRMGQCEARWFEPPFTAELVVEIQAGRLPKTGI